MPGSSEEGVPVGPAPGNRTLLWAICGVLFALPAEARAPAENRLDVVLRARLDGDTKRLDGSETLTWTNGTADSVDDLQFHLYLNAFSNNRSTHLHEARGKFRGGHVMKDGWSWSRITAAELLSEDDGGTDLLSTLAFIAPDDGREEDRTVFSLSLPEPVGPGETIRVALEWESQLPRVRRRTGYKDDFLLVAQWFPKLGVYEEGRGWNCHQFHRDSEFYSDYGTYDVTLDLPASYRGDEDGESKGEPKVGGSGAIVSAELKGDDRLMVRFLAPTPEDRRRVDRTGKQALVHDFTWTADPTFVVHRELFRYSDWEREHAKDVAAARRAFGEEKELELHNVEIRVLIHPERIDQAGRHAKATAAALFFYGLWFGEYPYKEITVVDPPWGGRAAGGMEYPTLFTCGTRLFTTEDMYTPESVTVHEAGHQFWYGLVGNNEFESAWLDEGFNSYTDSEVMYRVYGPERITTSYAGIPVDGERTVALPGGSTCADALIGARIPLGFADHDLRPFLPSGFLEYWRDLPGLHAVPRREDPRHGDRRGYLRSPDADPLDTFAWEHVDRSSYGTNSYRRTAVTLRTLRGLVGEEAFLRGMRHYAETWRYRHPYPDDFFDAFEVGSGVEDLDWYWDELFRGTGTADWSVDVTQKREPKARGYFLDGETSEYVLVGKDAEESDDDEEEEDGTEKPPWVAEVLLRRRGELRLPVDVRLAFENGETEEFVWTRDEQAAETWLRRIVVGPTKLVSVELDPHAKIWIDRDMSNDRWFDETDEVTATRWAERALSQTARYFQWLSRFGG